jgi:hypothetical protein
MLRALAIATLSTILASQVWPGPRRVAIGQSEFQGTQVDTTRLRHVKLQLRAVGEDFPKADKYQYGKQDTVWIQVLALNSSSQPIFLQYSRLLIQFLPELSRRGEPIAYSKEMQKRIQDSKKSEAHWHDPNFLRIDSTTSVKLLPNELTQASLISLSSYYPNLEPGVYTLRIKYREPNMAEILSDPVMFEIVE